MPENIVIILWQRLPLRPLGRTYTIAMTASAPRRSSIYTLIRHIRFLKLFFQAHTNINQAIYVEKVVPSVTNVYGKLISILHGDLNMAAVLNGLTAHSRSIRQDR